MYQFSSEIETVRSSTDNENQQLLTQQSKKKNVDPTQTELYKQQVHQPEAEFDI